MVDKAIDTVVIEEPLAIHVHYWRKDAAVTENLAVTMRTPGADRELAAGLLLSEGVIQSKSDLLDVRSLGTEPSNEILAELAKHVDFDAWRHRRYGFVSSSCGVCGKAGIEQIQQEIPTVNPVDWLVTSAFINALPGLLNAHQATFHQTGGVHAAALISLNGKIESLYEDIGRHNALDKVMGHAALNNQLPLNRHVLFMSSRSSFELVQKAAMAGAQMLASVGSPSTLAIETARRLGMTLVGFVRDHRFNIYSGEWRIDL